MRALRVLLLLGAGAAAIALFTSGATSQLGADALQARLRAAGPLAPALYVLLFSLLEPFGVLGIVFVVPGSLIWSWPQLFLWTWLGAIGAGIVGFGFARTIGREWVARHLPERARRFDERLATHGFRTVVLVRLALFLSPPAHWLLGLSRVGFVPFVLGTAVGFLPGIALLTYVGKGAVDVLLQQPAWVWITVAGALAVGALLHRRLAGRDRPAARADAPGSGLPDSGAS